MRSLLQCLALSLMTCASAGAAHAQEDPQGRNFLPAFPTNDVYKIVVVGDSLADGLLEGLIEGLSGDARVDLQRKKRSFNGLMRENSERELAGLEQELKSEAPHVVIVLISTWDRVSVRGADGRRLLPDSPEWKAEYARRVDKMTLMLKQRNIAVYWVGLPVMRRWNVNETARLMNEVIREKVYLRGQKFIDTFANFVDETGGFSAYGPDLSGKNQLLREGDGIHFTSNGNRKLAHFVEREIKRDLTLAKNDRVIPLAGDEAEQASLKSIRVEAETKTTQDTAAPTLSFWATPSSSKDNATPAGEQKADDGSITLKTVGDGGREETVVIEIARPPISASVVALVTRREAPDKPSRMGEELVSSTTDGFTVMNSITPAGEYGGDARSKASPTQLDYFRVIVKGERLISRPGRADDFTWPRSRESSQSSPPAE